MAIDLPINAPLTDAQAELTAKVGSMKSLLALPSIRKRNIPKANQISAFDYLLKGVQISKLGVLPGYSTVENDQRRGYGVRTSLRLNLYSKYCTAFAEGFFRYWAVGQSDDVPDPTDPTFSIFEPRNYTREVGLRLGLQI